MSTKPVDPQLSLHDIVVRSKEKELMKDRSQARLVNKSFMRLSSLSPKSGRSPRKGGLSKQRSIFEKFTGKKKTLV